MNIKKYKNYLFLLPFIFLFLILLNWHHSIGLSIDDLFFYTIPQETNIMSFVIERYDIWSSRILIEYILCHILQSPLILWWYLDSLIFTFIAILTYKLINGENNLFYSILSCILCLSFIFSSHYALGSAGFVTTTINLYLAIVQWIISPIYFKKSYCKRYKQNKKNICIYNFSTLSYVCSK